jgi:hypothetical protein
MVGRTTILTLVIATAAAFGICDAALACCNLPVNVGANFARPVWQMPSTTNGLRTNPDTSRLYRNGVLVGGIGVMTKGTYN